MRETPRLRWRRSGGGVEVAELAADDGREAPGGLGGAAVEGALDIHPVRGLQEDDLGPESGVIEPAA